MKTKLKVWRAIKGQTFLKGEWIEDHQKKKLEKWQLRMRT